MIVHQAIYGDKLGSYALLETSLKDIELAKRICNVTDLLDRPPNGYLSQPVFRGFAFYDYYLFIKSFPDNDSAVRDGRVLSHTLIVNQNDLYQLNDLSLLTSHFISEPDKNSELSDIVIDDGKSAPIQIINDISREAAAINGLLYMSGFNNTVIWIGEKNYHSFIAHIWNQFDGGIRVRLKLGVGFNSQRVDPQKLNILYVMEEYASKWKTDKACVIDEEKTGALTSMSSFLLAGHKDKSKLLSNLIKTFEIVPTEIDDYIYLETAVETYNNISTATEFNRLIVLCDLISRYSPDPKVAKTAKHELLTHVISRVATASADQIQKLKNANWKGFDKAEQLISIQIANWITTSLFVSDVDDSATSIIAEAFDLENKVEWWKAAFSNGIKTALKNWEKSYALAIWKWFSEDIDLVETLGSLIPTTIQAEADLVDHWQNIDPRLAQKTCELAKKRHWLTLHGLSLLRFNSSKESIRRQLVIDSDPEYTEALNEMSELIPDMEFIHLAVEVGEKRLISIAAAKVAKTPSLLSSMDVRNNTWRQIWQESIGQGMPLWDGITGPLEALYVLFEEVLNGVQIESQLLLMISKSGHNDIANFKRRSEVWRYLDQDVKVGFINATAVGCVRLLEQGSISTGDIEPDIRKWLLNAVNVNQLIEDATIAVSTKIQLFEELEGLREHEFIALLKTGQYTFEESERLGKLILRKRWKKSANATAKKVAVRKDLKPALRECQSLLGFFEKIRLSRSGILSEIVSKEDWWSELIKQSYSKYPNGPMQLGLWERAGGQNYDLQAKGTGREIWLDAINMIRRGGNVDVQSMLKEMRQDFPASTELKQLESVIEVYYGE